VPKANAAYRKEMSMTLVVLAARSDGAMGTLVLVTLVVGFLAGVLKGGRRGR
jgi:hypothetical protein